MADLKVMTGYIHYRKFWGDVTSDIIGVPPFVTSSHLLGVTPPSLSGVTSFMDSPLGIFGKGFWAFKVQL